MTQVLMSLGPIYLLREYYKFDSEFPGSQNRDENMVSHKSHSEYNINNKSVIFKPFYFCDTLSQLILGRYILVFILQIRAQGTDSEVTYP